MPKYHVLRIEELGEIEFYGNLGAVGEFEDRKDKSIGDVFAEGKTPKFSDIIALLYECHVVACLRQRKSEVEFERFKAFADNSYLEIFQKVMADILDEMTKDQKKTKVTAKKSE